MIEAKSLSKHYGDTIAVDDLSFTVQPGLVTGFLGPNGAGKSTTMRLILGLDSADQRQRHRQRLAVRRPPPAADRGRRAARGQGRSTAAGAPTTTCCAIAQTNHIGRKRIDEVLELVGLATRGEEAGRRLLARHGSAARHRDRAARRPLDPDPRRAGQRTRSRGHPLDPQPAQTRCRPRENGLRLEPPDERDGA